MEVHKPNPDKEILVYENCWFGYDTEAHSPTGIGADDKNGIYIALEMLSKHPNIKVAFFREEEIGCIGSGHADMKFFEDCRFVIQCDRKGSSDFINNASGTDLCSKEFIEDAHIKDFGYKLTNGLSTDVMKLKKNGLKVSCCNMSCGYYNPHHETECTDIIDLENCMDFVDYMITNMTKVYPHEYKVTTYEYPKTTWECPRQHKDNTEITKEIRKFFDKFKNKKKIPATAWIFWQNRGIRTNFAFLEVSKIYHELYEKEVENYETELFGDYY